MSPKSNKLNIKSNILSAATAGAARRNSDKEVTHGHMNERMLPTDGISEYYLHWGETRSRFHRLSGQKSDISMCVGHKCPGSMLECSTVRSTKHIWKTNGHRSGYDPDKRRMWRRQRKKLERELGIDRW